ncbi:FabD/lysophospholipase-like protein, partial [Tuber magnatum]
HLDKPISSRVCFGCLARFPDRRLPCLHSFCEICFEVFGKRCNNQLYTFHILECTICFARFDGIKVHIQTPTAGARMLTVDGGGIRGVVTLISLIRLQAAISRIVGVKLPIQEHFFDMAIGTSSRGLIALGLFSQGWSVDEWLRQFIWLTNKAFRRRPHPTCLPILCRVIDYMNSFAADSQYSADGIEEALKEAFGDERDMCARDNNRTKVAITATTTNSLPCVFTSYNSGGERPLDCGYTVVRPYDRGIKVWEAGWCTSAAPWYFSPKRLAGLGTFHDGGLWQNNPTSIGLWEWPHVCPDAGEPDLVLSL